MRIRHQDVPERNSAKSEVDIEALARQFNFPRDLNLEDFPELPEEYFEMTEV